MRLYLIVSIQETEEGQSYGNDIVVEEGKISAVKKFLKDKKNEGCLILNVICLTD